MGIVGSEMVGLGDKICKYGMRSIFLAEDGFLGQRKHIGGEDAHVKNPDRGKNQSNDRRRRELEAGNLALSELRL